MNKTMMRVLIGFVVASLAGSAFPAEEQVYHIELTAQNGEKAVFAGTRQEIYRFAEESIARGDYQLAKVCYERLIVLDPRDVRAHLLLGKLYQYNLQKYPKAVLYYKKAERLVPMDNTGGKALCQRLMAEAYRSLAEKSNSLIYFVQAISEYEKVLEYDQKDVEVLYYLASCRLNINDFETAIQLFERVVKNSPKSEWAEMSKKGLEYARKEKGKHGDASGSSGRGRG